MRLIERYTQIDTASLRLWRVVGDLRLSQPQGKPPVRVCCYCGKPLWDLAWTTDATGVDVHLACQKQERPASEIRQEVWHQVVVDGRPVAAYPSDYLARRHIAIFHVNKTAHVLPVLWTYSPDGTEWTAEGQAR